MVHVIHRLYFISNRHDVFFRVDTLLSFGGIFTKPLCCNFFVEIVVDVIVEMGFLIGFNPSTSRTSRARAEVSTARGGVS